MEVNFSFPAKTVPEFINYARANPGKISFAWRRYRTASLRRAFRYDHRYRYIYVAYRGDIPAVTDLLAGHVDQLPASIEHVRAGRLRGLAVTSAERIHRVCQTYRPSGNSCPASSTAAGSASALPETRPWR